ncbi:MAG: proP 2 [Gammaproteobacteria bacterium]|jgi:MHS family proline/betaine transporter-like MFS transporter|nr:proP 2 [Gammaproteobacteria bacterium]
MPKRSSFLITIGATIGSLCEWYNFLLYGYLAPIISQLFFPTQNKLLSLILTFFAFALSFLARPLGGLLFGWIGDNHGRQHALLTSLALIGAAALGLALLPTYQQIGIASPILLCTIRIFQGFSAGGEHTGSAIYLAETAPANRQAFWVSLVPSSTAIGILISSLTALALLKHFSSAQLLSGAWRIGYFAGFLLCLISFCWRLFLPESPLFQKPNDNKLVLAELIKSQTNFKKLLFVFGLSSSWGIMYQILFVWMPTYLSQIHLLSHAQTLSMNSILLFIFALLILLTAWIADYVNKDALLKISAVALLAFAYPIFKMLNTDSLSLVYVGLGIFTLLFSIFLSTAWINMVQAFPVNIRYTGLSLGFNLGLAFFGGTCPLVVTWLIEATGSKTSPAWYMIFAAVMALVCIQCYQTQPSPTTHNGDSKL